MSDDIKKIRELLTASGKWPSLEDAEQDDHEHSSYECPSCGGEGRIGGELCKSVHYGSIGIQIYGIGEQMAAMEELHQLLFDDGGLDKLLTQIESKP